MVSFVQLAGEYLHGFEPLAVKTIRQRFIAHFGTLFTLYCTDCTAWHHDKRDGSFIWNLIASPPSEYRSMTFTSRQWPNSRPNGTSLEEASLSFGTVSKEHDRQLSRWYCYIAIETCRSPLIIDIVIGNRRSRLWQTLATTKNTWGWVQHFLARKITR